ncbi:MAG: DUF3147 family protein [Verrucomicrobiales bacterium]|jgi:hypothetical protein|nr:DUF3147 family protein [Verrucomicrobiales bacterium]MDP4793058.1 DUF3147 family protein [Verrucomicrobiales bacterium]MDP5007226.1 DUF3147 family protein [Verrucomicrobiales bacterium]
MLTIIKLLVSAGLIYAVNEIVITRSRPFLGSLIASLPLVSLITFVWIYFGMQDNPAARTEKLAAHSAGVFWFVLPSLPMFLVFPWLLRKGIAFWPTLLLCCLLTMMLYAGMAVLLKRFGIDL